MLDAALATGFIVQGTGVTTHRRGAEVANTENSDSSIGGTIGSGAANLCIFASACITGTNSSEGEKLKSGASQDSLQDLVRSGWGGIF